ncbi:MAG: FlxA-like family protein [Bacillota bacterium]|nr:FlxA-like family protein [Bacillota bacterium]
MNALSVLGGNALHSHQRNAVTSNALSFFKDSGNSNSEQDQNSAVTSLMKWKESLQDQLKQVQSSQEDAMTKQAKVKELTAQIQQIEQQIAKTQVTQEQDSLQIKDTDKNRDENSGGVILSASLVNLVSAQKAMSQASVVGKTKSHFEADKTVAAAQIKNGVSTGSTTYLSGTISEADAKIAGLSSALGEKLGKVVKDTRDAAKNVAEASDRSNKAKQDDPTDEKVKSSQPVNDNPAIAAQVSNNDQAAFSKETTETISTKKRSIDLTV